MGLQTKGKLTDKIANCSFIKLSKKMTVLLRACVIFWHLFLPSILAKEDAIIFTSELHQDICAPSKLQSDDSRCCGFCNNGKDCELYGSCCLNMHEKFADGKLSVEKTR